MAIRFVEREPAPERAAEAPLPAPAPAAPETPAPAQRALRRRKRTLTDETACPVETVPDHPAPDRPEEQDPPADGVLPGLGEPARPRRRRRGRMMGFG